MKAAPPPLVPADEPLPVTRIFVYALGFAIFAGWLALFILLRSRW